MKVTNQPNINLTTAWTEITSNSVIRFLAIYIVSGNINIQVYDNSGYGSTIQKNSGQVFTYFSDIKKFRIAAQAGTAIVNYFYQEETLQITAQTEKASPHDNDLVVIEDSEDSLKQKKVKMSNIKTPPAGSDTQLQFNDGALFGGIPELVYDKTLKNIKIPTKFVICGTFTSDGINAAIDELGISGGEVYLPEGEYAITSTITIDYANTIIRGAGFGTYLNATTYNGHVFVISGKANCQITNLRIKGSAGSGYTQNLITDGGVLSAYFVCRNVKLEDADNIGISWTASGNSYGLFDNVNCDNADSNGFYIFGGRYNKIINCSATNNGGTGLSVYRDGNIILGGFYSENTINGIYCSIGTIIQSTLVVSNYQRGIFANGLGCQIENNFVSFNSRENIYVIGNNQIVIGNYLYAGGNNYVDLLLGLAHYSTVIGNYIYSYPSRSEYGIYLDNSDYCNVQGNMCQGHDMSGIYVPATTTNAHIINNYLELEVVAKITDLGVNTTIINSIAGNTSWLKDNAKVMFGAASDASVYYDGIDMNIKTDEAAPSDLKIHTGAAKTLELLTPVYDDLNFSALNLKLGASPPDLINILDSGGLYGYAFNGMATLEEVFGSGEILHSYKEGTDLLPHIHWMPIDTNSGNVKWFLEYSIINKEGTFSAPTIISIVDVADGTAWKHQFINFSAISGIGLEIGSHIIFRIYRDPSDVDDTYGQDAVLLSFGLHYQKCRLGSRQPTIA